jgi:hypothetical protein
LRISQIYSGECQPNYESGKCEDYKARELTEEEKEDFKKQGMKKSERMLNFFHGECKSAETIPTSPYEFVTSTKYYDVLTSADCGVVETGGLIKKKTQQITTVRYTRIPTKEILSKL